MFSRHFYNSSTVKYVIMFGALFRDITVRRYDKNKNVIQNLSVPISFSPKRKWEVMYSDDQDQAIAMQLPRVAFYLQNISPETTGDRKTSPLNNIVKISDKNNEMYTHFNAIPYKISFDLYIIAKNQDDAFQIVEQIIPYFNPDFTSSVRLMPIMERSWDIKTTLKSVNLEEQYDGTFDKRQIIIHTLNFEVDAWFFGPIEKQGVIKRIQLDFNIPPGDGPITAKDIATTSKFNV